MLQLYAEKFEDYGLIYRTFITLAGPVAIVTFRVSSISNVNQHANISLSTRLYLGNSTVTCSDFGNGTGFFATANSQRVNFFAHQTGLIANADAYWFGSNSDATRNLWSHINGTSYFGIAGMSISWHRRLVPAHGEAVMSTLMSWGIPSDPPVLDINWPRWELAIENVSGTIKWAAGDSVSILIVVNDDFSRVLEVGTLPPGSTFAQDLHINGGSRDVSVYAIDSTGAISKTIRLVPTPSAEFSPHVRIVKRARFLRCTMYLLSLPLV
jgi:hypothetical protein